MENLSDENKIFIWQQIKQCGEWRFVGCSIKSQNGEVHLDNGLIAGHAYGIVSHNKVTFPSGIIHRLVKIRNPHASGKEWNGKWSDKSHLWKKYPEVAKACGHTDEEDGMFWMNWNDFLHTWSNFFCTRICPDNRKYTQLYDYSSSEGYTRYSFKITQEQDVVVVIDQYDLRYAQKLHEKYPTVGITIRTGDNSWKENVPSCRRRRYIVFNYSFNILLHL